MEKSFVDKQKSKPINLFIVQLNFNSKCISDNFIKHLNYICMYMYLYISGGWKIQKMVKKSWLSLKEMCIWCEKFQKKFGLNWRFPWKAPAKTCSLGFGSAIYPLHVICKAICGPKKFHPVCLTFLFAGVSDDHNSSKWLEFTQDFEFLG